jgi:hypothetical protein
MKEEWHDVKHLDGARAMATGSIKQWKASKSTSHTHEAIVVRGQVLE